MGANTNDIWVELRAEAANRLAGEPMLASFYHANILNHASLSDALAYVLAERLETPVVSALMLVQVVQSVLQADQQIVQSVADDLVACRNRDPACSAYIEPFLHFKGFHALQTHRIAHGLWQQGRRWLAYLLQGRSSEVFAIDIHPAARLGSGIMLDHGTGLVIGETAEVGNEVSILHSVTLGGSGCHTGDRHPKVADGVLISVGARLIGPIRVGEGAKIGAGSLVLEDVPAHCTVAGVPARIIGHPAEAHPSLIMDQGLDTSAD